MKEFSFPPSLDTEDHECEAHREGDWIVFRCPDCLDYERRFNWRTGEMKVKNASFYINHRGEHVPSETLYPLIHRN
jgi:hypothetical protein